MIRLNRKRKREALFLVCLLFVSGEFIFGSFPDISGYYKSFFSLISAKSMTSQEGLTDVPDLGIVTNSIRLKTSFKIASDVKINIAYDIYPSVTYNADSSPIIPIANLEPSVYRFKDLNQKLYPPGKNEEGNFTLNHNLDRFFLTIKSNIADFYIGRQSISWGSARVFNPTDILAPFNFNQLDKEERVGIDAVRVRVPVGTLSEIDAGYVFGNNFEFDESAFFLRGKFNIFKSDVTLLVSGFRENFLYGIDLSSSIGGAGVWLECSYVKPGLLTRDSEERKNGYLRVSVGSDYNLRGNTYIFFEYHYNGAGQTDPSGYLELFNSVPYTDGNVYQMGRNYLSAGINKQLHPLISLNLLSIYNISDSSLIFSPLIEYNISENIYLSLGGFLGFGRRPEYISGPEEATIDLRSEFGTYPNLVYSSFRIYF